MVQFQKNSDLVCGQEDILVKGEIHYLVDEDDCYEYFLGENDDGDEEYDELASISFTSTLESAQRNRFKSYTPRRQMDYAILTIEMED